MLRRQALFLSLIMLASTCMAGIFPTAVQINIGPFPVDHYWDMNTDGTKPLIDGCSQTITVQQCVQQLFSTGTNNWQSQGVTGVRFFFTMAGGWYSTPFDSNGNLQATWTSKLYSFFSDLRSYGIQYITPTPTFDGWSGPPSMMQSRVVYRPCDGTFVTRNFLPWLPYPLDPDNGPNYPDSSCGNASYSGAPQTPDDIFWGWSRFFNLMGAVMSQAQAANLVIDGLDYFQETNIGAFTVQARMIYDSYRSVDVLAELRSRMSAHGFSSGRVTPSANIPPQPNPASGDCASIYGDSAMLITLSELTAAIAGPWSAIGMPQSFDLQYEKLMCANSYDTTGMISLPVWHSQPTHTDIHSQMAYSSPSDTAVWAKNFYSDVWAFMQYRGLTGNHVVFGETNPVETYGEWTQAQASAAINGLSNDGYKNSTLFSNVASNVVMRPWHNVACYQNCVPGYSPNVINPPYDPYNP